MTVRELIEKLAEVDPDAIVIWLDEYADRDESDEVREVDARGENWTRETGYYGSGWFEVRYPGDPVRREPEYNGIVTEHIRVVVLSSGPTNLRFE
ncbi:conserved protein of unknown function [Pararobbsia alpina]|uniref:hypothetical protein n=1 Tax=Pararobbsia alpina TaxID=621374 RepID=UPI0039A641D8